MNDGNNNGRAAMRPALVFTLNTIISFNLCKFAATRDRRRRNETANGRRKWGMRECVREYSSRVAAFTGKNVKIFACHFAEIAFWESNDEHQGAAPGFRMRSSTPTSASNPCNGFFRVNQLIAHYLHSAPIYVWRSFHRLPAVLSQPKRSLLAITNCV